MIALTALGAIACFGAAAWTFSIIRGSKERSAWYEDQLDTMPVSYGLHESFKESLRGERRFAFSTFLTACALIFIGLCHTAITIFQLTLL